MTVASTTTPLIQYNGNGATTAFSTSFVFNSSADLVVTLTSTSDVDEVQTLTTDYTVSGGSGSSGTVTMLVAPASGEKLTIQRVTPKTQTVDYVENDAFPAAVHEGALDKLTYITQEIVENLDRVFTVSATSGVSDLEIPVVPNAYVKWNSDGSALDVATIVDFDAVDFNGTGLVVNDGTSTLIGRTLTGTSNEITVTNGTGISGNPTLSLPSTLDLKSKTVTLQDNNLNIVDNSDNTKVLNLQLSGITTATTRTLTVPNASGTIALTSDITGFAPTDPSYVTLGTNGTLTNERVLTAGTGISLTDAGAGSTITIANTGLTGTVLQVVHGSLTSTTSSSSTTYADTGLTVNITPSSASNKVLVMASVTGGTSTGSAGMALKLLRAGSDIAVGDAASSRTRSSFGGVDTQGVTTSNLVWLDSPSTTSSTTYKVQFKNTPGTGTVYINRTSTDTDSAAYDRYVSSIVVMEIKG